jgi:uncharacterized membrane protein (UPF0127 family)
MSLACAASPVFLAGGVYWAYMDTPAVHSGHPIRIVVLLSITVVLIAGFFALKQAKSSFQTEATLVINGKPVAVELFDTPEEKARGLSGRKELAYDRGALFVYTSKGLQGIWMKDMHFAIDVLWLDQEGGVVDLADDMRPESYPQVFESRVPAYYVLELPDTAIADYNISIGTEVDNLPQSR